MKKCHKVPTHHNKKSKDNILRIENDIRAQNKTHDEIMSIFHCAVIDDIVQGFINTIRMFGFPSLKNNSVVN